MPTKRSRKRGGKAILLLVISQVAFDFRNNGHEFFSLHIEKQRHKQLLGFC